jgi:four helix bundle protein
MSANSPLHDNLIVDKTFNFAVLIFHFVRKLQESKDFVIANQLLKSGTSIGANVREAQNSESLADFIHKFKIAAKEQMKPNIGFYFAKKL